MLPSQSLWTQSPQLSSHHHLCQLGTGYTPVDTMLASDVLSHFKIVFKFPTILFVPEDSIVFGDLRSALSENERSLFQSTSAKRFMLFALLAQLHSKRKVFLRGQGAVLAHGFYTRACGYSVWPTAGFIGVDLP